MISQKSLPPHTKSSASHRSLHGSLESQLMPDITEQQSRTLQVRHFVLSKLTYSGCLIASNLNSQIPMMISLLNCGHATSRWLRGPRSTGSILLVEQYRESRLFSGRAVSSLTMTARVSYLIVGIVHSLQDIDTMMSVLALILATKNEPLKGSTLMSKFSFIADPCVLRPWPSMLPRGDTGLGEAFRA
jgi:hypothetical protein